jgi:hypothetical protein
MRIGSIIVLVLLLSSPAIAQETVFNVPSADILDKGKTYLELDTTLHINPFVFGATPRIVFGIGHKIEAGVNVTGMAHSPVDDNHTTLSPAVKWKPLDKNGWAILVGDNVFLPVQNRTYNAGNYAYGMLAKTWKHGTRISAGGYHFSNGVVANAQRAGGQFSFEQTINSRVSLAADWYTGNHANGYFTPGFVIKASSKVTVYASYEIGNANARQGNHMLELELGWNIN